MARNQLDSGPSNIFDVVEVLENVMEAVVFLTPDLKIKWSNQAFEKTVGLKWTRFNRKTCFSLLRGEKTFGPSCIDCPVIRVLETAAPAEGDVRYGERVFRVAAYPVLNKKGEIEGIIRNSVEVTNCRNSESHLRESETGFKEFVDFLPETVFELDNLGNTTFVNSTAYKTFGYTENELPVGFNVEDHIVPKEKKRLRKNIRLAIEERKSGRAEYTAVRKDGTTFPVVVCFAPIIRNDKAVGIRGILFDMTDVKNTENQLRYLSSFDSLTGLYNRSFFEKEMKKMDSVGYNPVGLIICDLDGLKLINDTLGHSKGDEHLKTAAGILDSIFHDGDVVSRVGGDEFAILMPGTSEKKVIEMANRIRSTVESYNQKTSELPLNISVGYAVRAHSSCSMEELFKQADNNMYREKLHRKDSTRSSIVKTLTKAMEERDFITEGHAGRLCKLVAALAEAVDYPESGLGDLSLFAQFHDIGKVGIPDRILFKKGPLTPAEMSEMQRHSEIGHRIALSSPDLIPIADWILKHHEWWDGNGYPLKLKGNSIPLECRILAVADAYDSITNDRPYRAARSHWAALKELERCAGTQFDADLVEKFVRVVADNPRGI